MTRSACVRESLHDRVRRRRDRVPAGPHRDIIAGMRRSMSDMHDDIATAYSARGASMALPVRSTLLLLAFRGPGLPLGLRAGYNCPAGG